MLEVYSQSGRIHYNKTSRKKKVKDDHTEDEEVEHLKQATKKL